jgi:hypothetical protein
MKLDMTQVEEEEDVNLCAKKNSGAFSFSPKFYFHLKGDASEKEISKRCLVSLPSALFTWVCACKMRV